MNRTTCPFLGLQDDPATALDFPSPGNFCHHAKPIAPVKGTYQQVYCLTAEHTACPIFQAAQPQPLQGAMLPMPKAHSRRMLATLGIPVLLAGTTALVMAWNGLSHTSIPNTAGKSGAPVEWSLLNAAEPTAGSLETAEPTPTNTSQPQTVTCALPPGWVTYQVSPTDSLYRLSVIYGVSVQDLQRYNCMGDKTTILPGQVLYVPAISTNTPAFTDTAPPASNIVPVSGDGSSGISPNQPAATPTPVPPQPTQTPVPPKHNPAPPPAAPQPTSNPTKNPPHSQPPSPPGNSNPGSGNGNGNGNGNGGGGGNGNGNGNGGGHGNGHGKGHGGGNGGGNGKGGKGK